MKDGQTDDMLYWNEALGLFQRGVEPVVDLLNAANGWKKYTVAEWTVFLTWLRKIVNTF